jgi:hypothetical protein
MDDTNVDKQTTSDDPEQQLTETAEFWRTDMTDTDAADSADEVARGADQAAEQPGFGREGS